MAERTTVIVDEAYLDFESDSAQKTAVELTRDGANVVVFRTFGKSYWLAGMLIRYAVAPKGVLASLKRNGLGAPHSLNPLSVAAAAASLREPGYVDGMRLKVVEERQKGHSFARYDAAPPLGFQGKFRILRDGTTASRRDNRMKLSRGI